jgi:prevent-host-death family protein
MPIVKDILPITYLKANAADLLNQINETHRPVIITQNGEARAVLQDPESYEEMRNTIALLKILAISEEEIKQGKWKTQEEIFSSVIRQIKHSNQNEK